MAESSEVDECQPALRLLTAESGPALTQNCWCAASLRAGGQARPPRDLRHCVAATGAGARPGRARPPAPALPSSCRPVARPARPARAPWPRQSASASACSAAPGHARAPAEPPAPACAARRTAVWARPAPAHPRRLCASASSAPRPAPRCAAAGRPRRCTAPRRPSGTTPGARAGARSPPGRAEATEKKFTVKADNAEQRRGRYNYLLSQQAVGVSTIVRREVLLELHRQISQHERAMTTMTTMTRPTLTWLSSAAHTGSVAITASSTSK